MNDTPDYDAIAAKLVTERTWDTHVGVSGGAWSQAIADALRSADASATAPLQDEVDRLRAFDEAHRGMINDMDRHSATIAAQRDHLRTDLAEAVGLLRECRPYLMDYACDKVTPGSLLAGLDAFLEAHKEAAK